MSNVHSKLGLLTILTLSVLGSTACVAGDPESSDAVDSDESAATAQASVQLGPDGKLVYQHDANGDTIPDFSNVGYHGGGVALPKAPVVRTLTATTGDNLAAIQGAIDAVAKLPLKQRGAILLKKGTYHISAPIKLNASGIVLRGEGNGADGTVIISTSRQQITMIEVGGGGVGYGGALAITDAYVPVGARTVTLASTSGLAVGNTITVDRASNQAWIHTLGMDRIPPRKDGKPIHQWSPFDLRSERVITRIDGNKVTFDAPLTTSIDKKYGGGAVHKVTTDNRISEVGVESMRGLSLERVTDPQDENHALNFIGMTNVTNAWVQGVTGARFVHAVVTVDDGAKWVTVRRSTSMEPVGIRTGGRFYSFEIDGGQLTLFHECTSSDGRHDFALAARISGPNVFLESNATHAPKLEEAEVGPHHRWSTGTLFDNITVQHGLLAAYDRSNQGTGHGWSGANVVFWNSKADTFQCERPPTAHQWLFGDAGQVRTPTHANMPCEIVSPNKALQPQSLYRQQLAERLGPDALKALDAP